MISVILSRVTYFVFLCKFLIKALFFTKKRIVKMSPENALNLINSIYPDPMYRPQYRSAVMDSEIDLSVIIPVYNHAEVLEKNIRAVINQKTGYNYEIVLVDDGSTDGAAEIVQQFSSFPSVKVITQKNAGIAAARNTGLEHAAGRYIMFVDCDDTVHEDIVQVLLHQAYHNDCDIAMCAHNLAKEKNGSIYNIIPNIYPDINLLNYKNDDEIMNYAGLPWCKVYKRELWDKVRFFPGYWYEDNIIQFLLFTQCKKFIYIPKVEYEYIWHEKNFSHVQNNDKNIKSIDNYWILLAILEKYKELGLPADGQLYTLLLKHISVYYYNMIKGLDEDIVDALFVLARRTLIEYKKSERVKLPFVLRFTEKALLEGNINLWKLSSSYQ